MEVCKISVVACDIGESTFVLDLIFLHRYDNIREEL